MRDPDRWLSPESAVDPSVRDLLAAAAPPPPMPRADQAELSAFVAGLGRLPPPVAPWWHAPAWVKSGVAVVALASTGAGLHAITRRAAPERAPSAHAVPRVSSPPPAPAQVAPSTAPWVASSAAPSSAPPVVHAHHHDPMPAAPDDEAAMLEAARAAIAAGQMGRALHLLDRHGRHHADSMFTEERTFLRVKALLGVGRRADAARLAREYLDGHPHGLYAARVRGLVEAR